MTHEKCVRCIDQINLKVTKLLPRIDEKTHNFKVQYTKRAEKHPILQVI